MAANDEIMGISGHLDIGDIEKSINELISNLDKIGIKTDALSKRMADSMNEIAKSTDDTATKQKRAMEVLASGMEEAKRALTNYPEQLRLARNEADQTATATARLETELGKLNTKFSEADNGSKTYDELKTKIAGVQQQIENNNALHQQQLTSIQQMEAGYNGLVSIYGAANVATTANAVAHGATAVAVGVEAAQHGVNATEIGKEAEATKKAAEMSIEAKNANDGWLQSEKEVLDYLKQREEEYVKLRDSGEEYQKVLAAQSSLISTIQSYGKNVSDYDTALKAGEQQKKVQQQITEAVKQTTTEQKEHKKSVAEIEAELQKAQEEYRKMIGLSEDAGRIRTAIQENIVASQYNQGIISETELTKILEAKERIGQLKEELSNAKNEAKQIAENAAGNSVKTSFREQWNTVNELHSKLQSLSKELKDYETEYDRMAEKPGFDPHSQKAQELSDKIANLKKQIVETKQEMDSETGTPGGFLARWKNAISDFMTGNGKFQESLGNMKGALSGLIGPFTAATAGASAFAKSLWAMAATPIGAILGAIVIGLKAVHTWFTKSAEGQRAFAQISAFVGSLLSSLTDIGVKLGKYLYTAFTTPQSAVRDLGINIVALVIEPMKFLFNLIKMVTKSFSGLGNVAQALASGDWDEFHRNLDEAKKDFDDFGDAVNAAGESVAKTIQNAIEGVWNTLRSAKMVGTDVAKGLRELDLNDVGNNFLSKATEEARLAGKEIEAQKQLSEAKRDEKKLEIEIAQEREKIYMLTGKEKDAQIEKVKNMLKEKYEPQIAAQQKLLEIQQKRNKLHTVSLEQLAKEREAQGAVYALQAQQASSTRMLVRMQQANLRKMANEGKQDAKRQQQIEVADAAYNEVERKNAIARAKALQEMEEKITDARIAAMEEGGAKVRAEKNRQLEKELLQLDEHRKAAIEAERARQKAEFEAQEKMVKARGGNPQEWSDKKIDQSEIDAINRQYDELRELTVDRQLGDEMRKQIESMQDYLVEYGNYQQKKKAIEDKYNKLIEKAEGNLGEQMRLQAEKRSKQAENDMQNLQKEINWEVVFGNLDRLSTQALNELKEKLRKALSANNITPENAKVLSEKILEIEDKISAKTSFWANVIPYLKERERISRQVALSEQEAANAMERKASAQTDLSMKRFVARDTIEKATGKKLSDKELSKTKEEIMKNLGLKADSKEYKAVEKALDNLAESANNAAKATADLAKAEKTKESWDQIFKGTNGGIFGAWSDAVQKGGAWGAIELGTANIGSMGGLAEQLGLGGETFEQLSKGVNDAMGAVTDFASGNYIGALSKGISSISNLGESLGLWSNSNVAEMEAMIDRLEKSNAELGKALDDLRDEMHNTNLADTDAYERAQRVANAQIENGMRVVWAKMNEYDGHHSTRYYSDYATGILYKLAQDAMNAGKIDQKYIGETGYNTPFGYVGGQEINDILKYLTPADLDAIRSFKPEGWIKFMDALRDADKADLGAADTFLEYVDTYADTLKDLETEWKETLLNLSWDSLKSSFASALEDMEKSVEDWNDDLTDVFKKGVANYISTKYTDKDTGDLAKWYDKYYKAMESEGLTTDEIKDLREEYLAIVKEATEERDQLFKTLGITEQDKQSATFNSAQNITYEQADALVGIETAQLITQEQSLTQFLEQTGLLAMMQIDMRATAADVRGIAEGVSTIIETQGAMNNHLAAIELNTDVLPEMAEEIVRIRRKMDEQ